MNKTVTALIIVSSLTSSDVFASNVSVNGHATINGSMLERYEPGLPSYGLTENVDFKQDSFFSLRFNVDGGSGLVAAAEMMARGQDDFDIDMRWFYVGYEASKNTFVSAGKLRLPLFNYSDYLDVGMAFQQNILPQSFYVMPDAYTGGSMANHFHLGGNHITTQFIAGNIESDVDFNGERSEFAADLVFGASLLVETGAAFLRGAYFKVEDAAFSPWSEHTFEGVQHLQAEGLIVAPEHQKGELFSVGFGLRDQRVIAEAEHVQLRMEDSFTPTVHGTTATLGYRFSSVTPYITYETRQDKTPDLNKIEGDLPASIYSAHDAISDRIQRTKTYTAGVRWDFHPNAALKVSASQMERADVDGDKQVTVRFGLTMKF